MWQAEADTEFTQSASPTTAVGQKALALAKRRYSTVHSIIHNNSSNFQVRAVSKEWASRAALPGHVVTMLNNFPETVHPMSQFAAAITALNSESKFAKVS